MKKENTCWKFRLTAYRDGYRESMLFREDQKNQLEDMIQRFVNKGIKFKVANI